MMKCVSCSYENQEGAKFCRGCGAKLELGTISKQPDSLVQCVSCGSNNVASAKFCAKCGKKMTGEASPEPAAVRTVAAAHQERVGQPDIPTAPQKVVPNRKGIYAFVAIAIALIAIGGGGYFVIQGREQQRQALEKVKLELENKARMELEEKQRALAANTAAELAKGVPPAVPASVAEPAQTISRLDGEWYSPEWKYGYRLKDGIGVATSSNSETFKPGDVIIRIQTTSPQAFSGQQIYRDGNWYSIHGTIGSDGRMHIQGDRNVSWAMIRVK